MGAFCSRCRADGYNHNLVILKVLNHFRSCGGGRILRGIFGAADSRQVVTGAPGRGKTTLAQYVIELTVEPGIRLADTRRVAPFSSGCPMKPIAFLSSALLAAATAVTAVAEEGMWTPQQLPEVAGALKAAGLGLDPASLTRLTEFPMGAIVSLGGCSAAFVSVQGLVVTNHHCVYGSIQYNSTAGKNLLRDGFLAATPAEEVPAAPGSRVFVTVDVRDVTPQIIDAKTAKLSGKPRVDAIEANEKALVAACEQDAGHRCTVHSFYGGLEFRLIKQMEIRDVRLAYAPPEGVGKFGGDTDNWMWPRHTGDFGFYRAYVGKDGKPADFSADNVPYQPRHHLKLAREGLKEGDFVMVTGYPGTTHRHRLASEVDFTFGWQYPAFIEASAQQLEIIARETRGREAAALAYASTVASINNYYKNRQGMLDGYRGTDLLARKQAQAGIPELARHTAAVDQVLARRRAVIRDEFLVSYATPRLLGAARALYEVAQQKLKEDDQARKPGYQARDWPRIRQSLQAIDKRYDAQVDKALARHFLARYLALPAKERNAAWIAALGLEPGMSEARIGARLDELHAGSELNDPAKRLAWLERPAADFAASDDAFIKAAVALYPDDTRRENRDKAIAGDLQKAYAGYMRALIAYKNAKGEAVYPDANGTLRVTFGKVAGRAQGGTDGTAWAAFTTLRGIAAKHTGEGEFDAPDAQLAAIRAGKFDRYADPALGSVPVNFLATLDITGGNSGSPVLNSRAELVGLVFDGTLDSVISDWDFNPRTTRTISVDLRYMLWQMKVVDGAGSLLREMGAASTADQGLAP
jgi:hypothetical protein